MTGTLYQRVARTGGLPEVTGPERPALLRRAGAEAARAAMERLSVAERGLLVRALLPDGEQSRERLLPAAISLWCAARWDGAAPMPRDEAVRQLLHRIAFDGFPPRRPAPARNRPLGPVVWAVVFGIWCLIVIGLTNSDRPRPHTVKPPAPVAVPAPAPKPTYLPTTLPPAPVPLPNPVFDGGLREDWDKRCERQEREELLLELRTLRDDIAAERRLLDLERLERTRY